MMDKGMNLFEIAELTAANADDLAARRDRDAGLFDYVCEYLDCGPYAKDQKQPQQLDDATILIICHLVSTAMLAQYLHDTQVRRAMQSGVIRAPNGDALVVTPDEFVPF